MSSDFGTDDFKIYEEQLFEYSKLIDWILKELTPRDGCICTNELIDNIKIKEKEILKL